MRKEKSEKKQCQPHQEGSFGGGASGERSAWGIIFGSVFQVVAKAGLWCSWGLRLGNSPTWPLTETREANKFRSMEGHSKQHCAVRTDLYYVPDTFQL
jgi:hypothetical protein